MPTRHSAPKPAARKAARRPARATLSAAWTAVDRRAEMQLPLGERLNLWGMHFLKCYAAMVVGLLLFVGLLGMSANGVSLVQGAKFSLLTGLVLTLMATWYIPFFRSTLAPIFSALIVPVIVLAIVIRQIPADSPVAASEIVKAVAIPAVILALPVFACHFGYLYRSRGTRLTYRALLGAGIVAIVLLTATGKLLL